MDEVVTLFKDKKNVKDVVKELKLTKEDMDKIRKDMKPLREERREERKEERKDEIKEDRKDDRPAPARK
jgi:Spy/CpxP family protein refolding chaperone